MWLTYSGVVKALVGYADADGSMSEDCKAISGYTFLVNGGAVSWSAKQQQIISLSTTESEYVTATYAAKEALWLCQLISQIFGVPLETTTLFSVGNVTGYPGVFQDNLHPYLSKPIPRSRVRVLTGTGAGFSKTRGYITCGRVHLKY